ncbi:uncharacterized protein LOC143360223 [Halictus rubicundus]|uniref:uncharacterized protein LOC143360223 n=1 Tax=Halictus rubicundus TaxID=77578 RepID=UPI004035116E
MWLPLMLLALMATGSACPDLCECRPSVTAPVQTDSSPAVGFVVVKCRGRVPPLAELPPKTRGLLVEGAEDYEVISFFDELELADPTPDDFGLIGALNELAIDGNDTVEQSAGDNSTTSGLACLGELSFTNCSLVFLNATWRGLERVRSLNLSCNSLARLDDLLAVRAINMTGLARLDLSGNAITGLSAGAFRTLTGLVRLSLRRNAIALVHEDAFHGLDRLEFFDLSDNRLAKLPDNALTSLYSLQKLDLSGNQLQVLGTRWFENLYRLRELDVSRNGLARAASGTLQPLPGLSVLKLSGNPLKERDVSLLLGTGRRLETVDASRTGLARVPAALTRSVRALRLAGNKLTTIRGGDLDSYPLLRILDISENRLTDIEDDALGRLEVLEELDISGNVLVRVPRSLPSSLTKLDLRRNRIVLLKLNDLQGLCNLRSLSLDENRIAEIEMGSLGQLPLLETLDLSNNPIKTLPANTLSGPSNLAKLRLSRLSSLERRQEEQSDMAFPVPTPERLVSLDVSESPVLARQLLADDAALSACKSLQHLNLSGTDITGLRFDLPYMLPQLKVLDLGRNDWICTEDLYWVAEWLQQHEQLNKDLEPGRCAGPLEWSGSLLRELPSPPTPMIPTVMTTVELPSSSIGKRNLSSNAGDADLSGYRSLRGGSYNVSGVDRGRAGASTLPVTADETRFYGAPTSFRNASGRTKTRRRPTEETIKVDQTSSEIKNLIRDVDGPSYRRTDGGRPSINEDVLDNRVEGEKEGRPKGKPTTDSFATTRPPARKRNEQKIAKETPAGDEEKYARRTNNLTKEMPMGENGLDGNTMEDELNGRATNSDARVSEALSAGAHPGMLVLVGAILGAAAALTVVLSRRATLRRRDRYHRHENIEVHTLTPTTELW